MTDTTTEPSSQDAAGVAASAKDEAANVASTAKGEAANVASTAVDEAKQVGAQATDHAKQVLGDARQQLRAKAQEESHRLAGTIADVGQQLRTMANAGDEGLAKDLVAQAADRAHQVSQQLREGGLDRTLEDAKRLARNRPGTFLLGAAAAGFIAARVARLADTSALKDAATPSQNGNGQHVLASGSTTPPSGAPSVPAAPAPPAGRPLVADPLAPATRTATMPAVEPRP
jgi:hypothetical protein